MRYANCNNCGCKRDVFKSKDTELCRRCRIKKPNYRISNEIKEFILKLRGDGMRYINISKSTGVKYDTVLTICSRANKTINEIETFNF